MEQEMARTKEKVVKDAVVKVLKKHGVYYFFPATGGYGRSGVPDIICCLAGRFLAIECKAGDNMPTALQARELKNIRDAGGAAIGINEHTIPLFEPLLLALRHDSSVEKGHA